MGLSQSKAKTADSTGQPQNSSGQGWVTWREEDKKIFLDAMVKIEDFQKIVAQKLKDDPAFKDTFLDAIAGDVDFRTKVIEQMSSGEFKKAVIDSVKEDPDFIQLVKGIKGERGEIGPVGPAGPEGEKGEKGDRGETGPASTVPPQIQFREFNNIFAPDGGNYSLFGLGHNMEAPRGVIFKNGPLRQEDGGPNTMTIRNDGGAVRLGASGNSRIYSESGAVDIGGHMPGGNDFPGLNIWNKERRDWTHFGGNASSSGGITNIIRGGTRLDGDLIVNGLNLSNALQSIPYQSHDFVQNSKTGTDILEMTGTVRACQKSCNSNDKCIGFSRPKAALDNKDDRCSLKQAYPSPSIGDGTYHTFVKPGTVYPGM